MYINRIHITFLMSFFIANTIHTQLKLDNSLVFYSNPTDYHGVEIILDDQVIRDLPAEDLVITLLQQLTHTPEKILAAHRALTMHKNHRSTIEEFQHIEEYRATHPLLPFYEYPAASNINRQDRSCERTILENHIVETVEQRTQNQSILTYTSYASRGKFSDVVILSRLVRNLKKQIIINLIDHNLLLNMPDEPKKKTSIHHTMLTQNTIPLYYTACLLEWLNRTLKGNCKLFLYSDEHDYTNACLKNPNNIGDILVGMDYIKPQYESHLPLQKLTALCLKNNGLFFSLSKGPLVRSFKKVKPIPPSVIIRIAQAYDIELHNNAAVFNNYISEYLEPLDWDINNDCCNNNSSSWCGYLLYALRYFTGCFTSSPQYKRSNKMH